MVPFYVFITMFSNNNWVAEPGSKDRWKSLFDAKGATTTLLFAMFIASATVAGLHLLSAILDIWLVVLFRKISKLPPDMNPLEDNLTGRSSRQSKHKYKNSEATLTGSYTERKSAYLSGSTLSVDHTSRLSTATKDGEEFRKVPFQHSRMDSQTTFSPHSPETARWSRSQFEDVDLYGQPASARSSRVDVYGQQTSPAKRSSFVEYTEVPPPPPRSTDRLNSARPMSYPNNRSNTNLTSPDRYSSPALPNAAPTNAVVRSQQRQGLLNDNWVSVDDENSNPGTPTRSRNNIPNIHVDRHDSFEHQPLRMNPPTPPPNSNYSYAYPDPDDEPLSVRKKRAALTARTDGGNGYLGVQRADTTSSSVYSESAPSLKSSNQSPVKNKTKYYGDLAAATIGVRGMKSNDTMKSNGTVAAATTDASGMMALGSYGYSAPSPPPEKMKRGRGEGGRVVSRTGVDMHAPYPNIALGMRNREVSGKVAEEGRGGGGWWSAYRY
jgi:hypothetical protein